MMRDVAKNASAFVSGALFGAGLIVSGMTRPENVRGFLDFFGRWNPSLMFVMAGAILVHMVAFRLIVRRPTPVFATTFSLPTQRDIDAKLLVGSAVFGFGWGLGGFCPGPAIASSVTWAPEIFAFVMSMLVGLMVTARLEHSVARANTSPDRYNFSER